MLLVKRFTEERITFHDGTVLDIPAKPGDYNEKRLIALELNKHTVTVSSWLAPDKRPVDCTRLKEYIHIDEDFRIAAIEPDGSIVPLDRQKQNGGYGLYYSVRLGYEAKK